MFYEVICRYFTHLKYTTFNVLRRLSVVSPGFILTSLVFLLSPIIVTAIGLIDNIIKPFYNENPVNVFLVDRVKTSDLYLHG